MCSSELKDPTAASRYEMNRRAFSTWRGFEEEDLLSLGQHDAAQGADSLGADIHGGLSTQGGEHRVLNVTEGSAGQLEEETTDQTWITKEKTNKTHL